MLDWLRARRRRKLLQRQPVSDREFLAVAQEIGLLQGLAPEFRRPLFDAATLFLDEKRFEGCGGLEIDEGLRRAVALQAATLTLGLPVGIDALAQVHAVLVYPGGVTARRSFMDDLGVVTEGEEDLLGEAGPEGHVVLTAQELAEGSAVRDGFNLVLHEFAHQLDLASGDYDGVPPLPRGLDRARFAAALEAAAADLAAAEERGEETSVDPYAAEDPVEAFAVFTETFFELPDVLFEDYPQVFEQLRGFYGIDPRALRAVSRPEG